MNEAAYRAMIRRIEALENRVEALERRSAVEGGHAKNLLEEYPFGMNKTQAADALGVTRATIYSMIKDGRLAMNGIGRVIAESVLDLIEHGVPLRQKGRRKKAG